MGVPQYYSLLDYHRTATNFWHPQILTMILLDSDDHLVPNLVLNDYDKGARWQAQVLECDPKSVGGKGSKGTKPVPGKWFPAYDEPTSNAISAFLNSIDSLPKGHVGGTTTVHSYSYTAKMVIEVELFEVLGAPVQFIISMSHDGKPQHLSAKDPTVVRALRIDADLAAFRTQAQTFVDSFSAAIRRAVPGSKRAEYEEFCQQFDWNEFCTSTGRFPKLTHPNNPAKVLDFTKGAKLLGLTNVSKVGSIPRDILPEALQTSLEFVSYR